jgi:hypothetical protein
MPSANDRFKVSISFDITKLQEDGKSKPFATTTQDYSGLDYVQLVELQKTVFEALVPALLALGVADAQTLVAQVPAPGEVTVKKYK